MARFPFVVVVASLFVGCAAVQEPEPQPEPMPEPAGFGCQPVSRTVLAAGDTSPAGFGADEVLAHLADAETALRWADGATTALSLTVAPGEVAFVDYEYVDDGSGIEIAALCLDAVEVEAEVGFVTADGAFAEAFVARLSAVDAASVSAWIPLEGLAGTFDPWSFVGSDVDDATASLAITWASGAASGSVEVQGTGTDGEVAWAEVTTAATFGDAPAAE